MPLTPPVREQKRQFFRDRPWPPDFTERSYLQPHFYNIYLFKRQSDTQRFENLRSEGVSEGSVALVTNPIGSKMQDDTT